MKEIQNYAYIENLELSEYIAFPIYLIIILVISYYIQNQNINKNPVYKYYTLGVAAKLFGGIIFCLVYIFYYHGGDTISYFETARSLSNLLCVNPSYFLKVVTEKASIENYFLFDGRTTGYPWPYMYNDPRTFMVAKIVAPFLFISFNSYMLSTMLLSWISYLGIWRLYKMLSSYYKEISGQIAIAVLFLPSVLFWGSGIMKDTITLSASCWFISAFHNVFIVKKKRLTNTLAMFITGYVILSIKSYILIALLPGASIWILHSRIAKMSDGLIKYSIIPIVFVLGFVIGFTVLSVIGGIDFGKTMNDAVEKQADLKQGYYGGSSFDIGTTDASLGGMLSKAPIGIVAGLYRPFFFEAKSVVMLLSGIENLVYLYFSVIAIVRLGVRKFLKIIFDNPVLLFSLSYAILFSFIVGISTSNFGALVRFKIPYLPLLLTSLFILNKLSKKNEQ